VWVLPVAASSLVLWKESWVEMRLESSATCIVWFSFSAGNIMLGLRSLMREGNHAERETSRNSGRALMLRVRRSSGSDRERANAVSCMMDLAMLHSTLTILRVDFVMMRMNHTLHTSTNLTHIHWHSHTARHTAHLVSASEPFYLEKT
jgi:hypothetical protein